MQFQIFATGQRFHDLVDDAIDQSLGFALRDVPAFICDRKGDVLAGEGALRARFVARGFERGSFWVANAWARRRLEVTSR
ncbi:MAG: hypothetical protein WA733_21675 [Methylocystis sp.]